MLVNSEAISWQKRKVGWVEGHTTLLKKSTDIQILLVTQMEHTQQRGHCQHIHALVNTAHADFFLTCSVRMQAGYFHNGDCQTCSMRMAFFYYYRLAVPDSKNPDSMDNWLESALEQMVMSCQSCNYDHKGSASKRNRSFSKSRKWETLWWVHKLWHLTPPGTDWDYRVQIK